MSSADKKFKPPEEGKFIWWVPAAEVRPKWTKRTLRDEEISEPDKGAPPGCEDRPDSSPWMFVRYTIVLTQLPTELQTLKMDDA